MSDLALTPTQLAALRLLTRSSGAAASVTGTGWYAHDARGILVQISGTTARVLELDGLVAREGRRLALTGKGREWLEANV